MNNTSITQNTIDLQEILNTVENLPEAGSGGGVAVQSDYAQNDSSQPDYIKNRPFYKEGYSYEWDGTAPDESKKVSGNDSRFFYYKISDNIMAASDLVGAKITTSANKTATIADKHIKTYENGSFVYTYFKYYELLFVCVKAGSFETQMGKLELTPGLWFIYPGIYIRSLQGEATAKQLDNRYIPKATAIDDANGDLPVTAGLLKTKLENKADLVEGKIPVEQLPDGIGSGSASGGTGENGVSPTINVTDIEGGYEIIITDIDGEKEPIRVMNGVDGNDGVSPTIEVSPSEGGHTVSITDASGTPKSFEVLNGIDGEDGTSVTHSWEGTFLTITSASGQSYPVDLKGEKGDPFEYEDFTEDQLKALKPVKGTDYFDGDDYILTDADKTEIANKTKGLLDDTVQEMREIASGKCKADAFDTVEAMTTWLSDINNTANLKLGDVFYIRAVEVPDYWWEPKREGVELKSYIEGKDVIIEGVGAARVLETTKVALEDYVLAKDAPSIKVNNAVNADTIDGKTIQVITGGQPADGTSDNVITIVI